MHRYSNIDRIVVAAYTLSYYYGQWLGVINCKFDKRKLLLRQARRCHKVFAVVFRLLVSLVYCFVLPTIYQKLFQTSTSFTNILLCLQVISVMIFNIFSFIMQICNGKNICSTVNKMFNLFRRIVAKGRATNVFKLEFLFVIILKSVITLVGYLDEFPAMLQLEASFISNRWITAACGMYIWLGSMFAMDVCFVGFLTVTVMYDQLQRYIQSVLKHMNQLLANTEMNLGNSFISQYRLMQVLCEHADDIEECSIIYSELYKVTKQFQCIFEWQIIYNIYYNFMVVLMLLNRTISMYVLASQANSIDFVMIVVKILNLILLPMCVNYAVDLSKLPEKLALDIAFSDLDARWDTSVEEFLSRLKTESLEIRVLGFFKLNNQFVILMISAIISYLFIMIQFGVSDGFLESDRYNISQKVIIK